MLISKVIAHLREHCESLQGRVGGVLDWNDGTDLEQLSFKSLPCAFVIQEADEVSDNEGTGAFYIQEVKEKFSVRVFLSRNAKKDLQAYDEIDLIKSELLRALVGFQPCPCSQKFIHYDSGNTIIAITRGFLVVEYIFAFDTQLRSGTCSNIENDSTYIDVITKENISELKSLWAILKDQDSGYQLSEQRIR